MQIELIVNNSDYQTKPLVADVETNENNFIKS